MAQAEFPHDRWVRFVVEVEGAEPVTALALPALMDGRIVIKRLLIAAEHVDSVVVSRFPIGELEQLLNTAQIRQAVEEAPPNAGLSKPVEEALSTDNDPVRQVREAERAPRPRLRRPTGADPDGFYALVAEAYEEAAIGRKVIAATLAEESGAPIATVYRWIAEARRRGHIPPARRGKR